MKITSKQRKSIIDLAIKIIKEGDNGKGLCWAIRDAIEIVLNISIFPVYIKELKKFIPEFKESTAIKYFDARRDAFWWPLTENGKKHRLKFLRYLNDGKLPKVKK